jgi:hypothetical protein
VESCVLLQHPPPFKAHDAALGVPRIDHEHQCVVEPVVDVLAALVRQAEAEVKATVCKR